MNQPLRYYVEFEFKTHLNNYYWFPLFLSATNHAEAEVMSVTIQTALKEQYIMKNIPTVHQVIDGVNAAFINENLNMRLARGRPILLNFRVFKFEKLPTIPELNYAEHISIIQFDGTLSVDSIPKLVQERQFPVRLYRPNTELEFKEYLLIDVMDSSETLNIHLVIEIPLEQSQYFGNIQEGIWKDAYLKGYKMRVDAPHTPDGKRHVHIAHNKHIHSKDKQVSWNDDKTRHDKKTFDSNFTGMERAKEIARRALGLNDDAILEQYNPNKDLITENHELLTQNKNTFYLKLD